MKKTGGRKSRDSLPLNQIQGPESVKMESGSNSVANYADPQTWFKYFNSNLVRCSDDALFDDSLFFKQSAVLDSAESTLVQRRILKLTKTSVSVHIIEQQIAK